MNYGIEVMYSWEMEKIIIAFRGLKPGQILICHGLDENFSLGRRDHSIEGTPPDILYLDKKKYILTIIYHTVHNKRLSYLMKLAWFYTPASDNFDTMGACALFYKQRRKKRR